MGETQKSDQELGIGYARGNFVALDTSVIPIDDRAHQFGDGIYEVIRVYHGQPFRLDDHMERLVKSATEIGLRLDPPVERLRELILEGLRHTGIAEAQVYLQYSRAIARRDHAFPAAPSHLSMTFRHIAEEKFHPMREFGLRVMLAEDIRWKYCFIKSLNLLPNVLIKQRALDAGYHDAIFVRDGIVKEGTSSNIAIVRGGTIVTHPADESILHGITRKTIFRLAQDAGISMQEQTFSPQELLAADEIFFMSTLTELVPIVEVDGQTVGLQALEPGSVLRRLQRELRDAIVRETVDRQ